MYQATNARPQSLQPHAVPHAEAFEFYSSQYLSRNVTQKAVHATPCAGCSTPVDCQPRPPQDVPVQHTGGVVGPCSCDGCIDRLTVLLREMDSLRQKHQLAEQELDVTKAYVSELEEKLSAASSSAKYNNRVARAKSRLHSLQPDEQAYVAELEDQLDVSYQWAEDLESELISVQRELRHCEEAQTMLIQKNQYMKNDNARVKAELERIRASYQHLMHMYRYGRHAMKHHADMDDETSAEPGSSLIHSSASTLASAIASASIHSSLNGCDQAAEDSMAVAPAQQASFARGFTHLQGQKRGS